MTLKNRYLPWIFISVLYSPVLVQLYRTRWELVDYTHAYFVFPVALWMAYRKKKEVGSLIDQYIPRPQDQIGLAVLFLGLLMFVIGYRYDYLVVSSFSIIPVLWGLTLYLYGPAVVKTLSLPIFYLLFMVPPPMGVLDSITLPMRYGISGAVDAFLSALNFPVVKNGLILTVGGHEIFMGAPCSGFRSLITMLALTVAYVSFIQGSPLKKLLLTIAGIPLALFGNFLRVIALCLMTFYAGPKAAEGFFHDFSGGLVFVLMIISLMGLEHILGRFKKL